MKGTLLEWLAAQVERAPDAEALAAGGQRRSWGWVWREAQALAHGLASRGVAPGDRVVVFLESGAEAVVALWATHALGGICCLVNAHTRADKLAFYLGDLGARALVTQASLAPVCEAARAKAPALACAVVVGAPEGLRGAVGWEEAVAARPPQTLAAAGRGPEELAHVIYTSGTTGEPKGVALTHANMTFAGGATCDYLGQTAEDVVLCVLPLSFSYGLYQVLCAARVGSRVALEKGFAFPVRVLERLAAERATSFAGVPTLFAMFAELEGVEVDLSSVRVVTNAAAALPERLVPAIAARFPQARFFSMYGQTECMRISYLPPHLAAAKPRCVGVPLPGTSFFVAGDDGRPLPAGASGELVVVGRHVMHGYWNRPLETARKVKGGPDPAARQLWTGDECRLDEDGHLYVLGRRDDVIKSRGEKVAPLEVERALCEVKGVREAAVVGVPDDVLGQAVKAFVVLEHGAGLTERELVRECQRRLEPHMVPRQVAIVPALPRNASGKVVKAELG